jgi:hypothetical protein
VSETKRLTDERLADLDAGCGPSVQEVRALVAEVRASRSAHEGGGPDPTRWEVYEDLRSRYASAVERMGMAHANGTRAEWEDAARSEVERRLALNAAVRALASSPPAPAPRAGACVCGRDAIAHAVAKGSEPGYPEGFCLGYVPSRAPAPAGETTGAGGVCLTPGVGVILTLEQHNALLRVGDAVEAIPFCSDPECHAKGGCHVHRLAAANAVDAYVRGVLSPAPPAPHDSGGGTRPSSTEATGAKEDGHGR